MSTQPTWQELADLISEALKERVYGDETRRAHDKARDAIQKAFTAMRQHSKENETLRQMLVDLGVENARLSVEIEQERARTEAARTPPPIEPKPTHTKASLPRKGERA